MIVEDDISLSEGISLAFKDSGFVFIRAKNLAEARKGIKSAPFDLVILDLNLPDGNGLDFLRELRRDSALPVIILTANDMETDVVMGLELGADDYITKPFSLMILRARVNARLRNLNSASSERIEIEGFRFLFDKIEFFKNEVPMELSKTEQKLLRILLENRGHILTRSQLLDSIWGEGAQYVDENALSVTVKRLRNKLEDTPPSPRFIKTVYGIGYTWAMT